MEHKINPSKNRVKPPENAKVAPVPTRRRRQTRRPKKLQESQLPILASPTRPRYPWKRLVANLTALSILCGCSALMGGGAWLSYQLIVDPNGNRLVSQFVPGWSRLPTGSRDSIQTLAQIKASVGKLGFLTGEPLRLRADGSGDNSIFDLLLPVMVERTVNASTVCKNPCRQIVELRVYKRVQLPDRDSDQEQYFQLANSVNLEGPAESFVITSLADSQSNNQASNQSLPLTELRRFDGKPPAEGIWFNLSGKLVRGDKKIPYGQVVRYNPSQNHLISLLDWASAAGQPPNWQQIIKGSNPQLAIDQTVGLEPQFTIYQIGPRKFVPNPVQLTPISLEEFAFNDQTYKNGLRLANSGLWSPGLNVMRIAKGKAGKNWPALAQAQLETIEFHAKITRAQAIASWASPGQQVLAELIDGRWSEALQVFEADQSNSHEIATTLKNDGGRIMNRVDASLKINAADSDVKAWGALIVASQDGTREAMNWLDQQLDTDSETRSRIRNLVNKLDEAVSLAQTLEDHKSQIMGSATLINNINPAEWLEPEAKNQLTLTPEQVWYQVQVASFYDGSRWVNSPFTDVEVSSFPATQIKWLWGRLGLQADPKIKIEVAMANGQQRVAVGTVKAVQIQDGSLRLLAAVDKRS
ncbi:hypothetical protein IQ270_20740 [Microcoleus sp. LEGE 07076]|uniref:hypothetical protein n=1 Tax=Microcoleus sp. LEGE 07076 TaxID=915322 RepID=UPI00187E777E|nr:hypothetical protein [Microcoleus sp. LEGE 07076]MBE9187016.1 hypothetical protein [Microcoleus sp. LEGE 07076]